MAGIRADQRRKPILLVVNPHSGRTDTDLSLDVIEGLLKEAGVAYTIFRTTGKNDRENLLTELDTLQPEIAVACGGDGTVQLVAKTLIGRDITLGIIPLGSANGLAQALNIPKQPEKATALIIHSGKSIPLDMIRINDHICIHLGDIGTNALLVKNYEEAGDKGFLGYAKHLLSSIRSSELMQYTLITSQGTFHKEGYMLMLANANQYGTGVRISEGTVSDGQFEICNVEEITLASAVKAGLTALNVFVDKNMFSDVIRCTSAEITINRDVHLQIDGEYIGEVSRISAGILPSAVKIIVPEA